MKTLMCGLVAAYAFVVLVAAAGATGGALRMSTHSGFVGAIGDPAYVAARCPAGDDWLVVLRSEGAGSMTSAVYTGPTTSRGEHCTRLLLDAPGHSVGKVGGGVQTVVTPVGELEIAYEGTFVLDGTFPADYRTDGTMTFTVTGGTGMFTGASGHGHIDVVDDPSGTSLELNGALLPSG